MSTRSWWKRRRRWQVVLLSLFFLGGITGMGVLGWFLRDLPSPTSLRSSDSFAVSTQIFDRNGILLYEIFADENRTPIEIDSLPKYVYQATVAIEDKHFYRHFGLDFVGITRALIANFTQGRTSQGGSTITQQLVKVALLTRERTWERKAKEAVLTLAVEALYSKQDILEMYLNHVPYGGTAWGVESASQAYFNKSAKDLSLAEAAYLAGLPQSPSRYSPFGNTPQLGIDRQKEVLRRMTEEKFITEEEAEKAKQQTLDFAEKRFDIKAPHFVFYVRDLLEEQYGQAMVERGGLRVTTTLDLGLQDVVQASVSAEIATLQRYKVGNGAALVTRPNSGEILAMIGSHDYFDATHEGQINMTVRPRQPGSSMKPLNLATGLQDRKITLGSTLLDIPTCFQVLGQTEYCPRNSDTSFRGPVTLRQGLANSYNIPAVKVGALNGTYGLLERTKSLGLVSLGEAKDYGLSLALGAGEVPMTEMATAFGSLANQGVKVPLVAITKIDTYTGENLFTLDPNKRAETVEAQNFLSPDTSITERAPIEPKISTDKDEIYRVLDPEVAYSVSDIMSDNDARAAAFGTRSKLFVLGKKVAVKTGTTNDLRDNWTIGFTPEYLVAVWVGNTDNSAMNSYLVSGVTGAAPIWNDIMVHVLKDQAVVWPERPTTLTQVEFCRRSGLLPNPSTPADKQCELTKEYFWKGSEPQDMENIWRETWIVGQTGIPAREGDPTDQLKLEFHTLLSDPFTREYCLDCTRATVEVPNKDGVLEAKPVEERYMITAERLFEVQQGMRGWE